MLMEAGEQLESGSRALAKSSGHYVKFINNILMILSQRHGGLVLSLDNYGYCGLSSPSGI